MAFGALEFKIVGHEGVSLIGKLIPFITASGLATVWVLVIIGSTDVEAGILSSIVALVLSFGFVRYLRGLSRGCVKLTPDGLLVDTHAGKQIYNWVHISGAEIEGRRRPHSGGSSDAIVRIALSRSSRLGLLPRRQGTDVLGIPTLLVRSVRLRLEDPERFVSEVRAALSSRSST